MVNILHLELQSGITLAILILQPLFSYKHAMSVGKGVFKMLKICKKKNLGIKLLHAHLQYVCNIPAKYQMNILKALGGVDFTQYALSPISQYVQWSKIG